MVPVSGVLAYIDRAGLLTTIHAPSGRAAVHLGVTPSSLLVWLDDHTLLVQTTAATDAILASYDIRTRIISSMLTLPPGFDAVSAAAGRAKSFAVVAAGRARHAPSRLFRSDDGHIREVPVGQLFILEAAFRGPQLSLIAQRRDTFEQLARWDEIGGTFVRTIAVGAITGRYLSSGFAADGTSALSRFDDDPPHISTEIRDREGTLTNTFVGWGAPAWSSRRDELALTDRTPHLRCGTRVAVADRQKGIRAEWSLGSSVDARVIGWSGEAVLLKRAPCDLSEIGSVPRERVDVLALHARSGALAVVATDAHGPLWQPADLAD